MSNSAEVSNARIGTTHNVSTGESERIDKFIYHLMTGDTCVIPNVFDICGQFPEIREKYLEIYNNAHNPETKKGTVSEDMQILQGMAMDGDFVGFNLSTGESALYTGDFARVEQLTGRVINPKLTVGKNLEGVVHCVRLDVEYISEKNFNLKPVNLQVKSQLTEENTIFIPYWVIRSVVRVLKSILKNNRAVEITQAMPNGVMKTRYVSIYASVIKHFSDKFLTDVPKVRNFPMNFLIYLPTLGAPSTSIGLTRIDVLRIEKIKGIKDTDSLDIAPLNPDPINSLLQNELLGTYLETLFAKEYDEEGNEILSDEKERDRNHLIGAMNAYGANVTTESSVYTLMQKTHQMSAEGILGVWSVLPKEWHYFLMKSKGSIDRLNQVKMDSYGYGAMADLLRKHILMVSYLTKGTKFRRVIVTNSEEYLEELYGVNYRVKYESDMVRARKAVEILDGIIEGTSTLDELEKKLNIKLPSGEVVPELRDKIQQSLEQNEKDFTPSKSKLINARCLFQPKGSHKYYHRIPIDRIQSVTILSK